MHNPQTGCHKRSGCGKQREVGVVLVVDGVVLSTGHEFEQVWELKCDDARLPDQTPQPSDETAEIGNMSQDVVGDDQVSRTMSHRDLTAHCFRQKRHLCRHTLFYGYRGDILGWLDPQNWNPLCN